MLTLSSNAIVLEAFLLHCSETWGFVCRVRAARQLQRWWRVQTPAEGLAAMQVAARGVAQIDRACDGSDFETACGMIQSIDGFNHAR